MVFKMNLGMCLVFVLAIPALALAGPRPLTFRPSDFAALAFIASPAFLWAGGAWAAKGRDVSAVFWFVISGLLMGAELLALGMEVAKARQEAITHQETQSILGFLVILGEWAVGLPLLLLLAVIWRINRFADYEE